MGERFLYLQQRKIKHQACFVSRISWLSNPSFSTKDYQPPEVEKKKVKFFNPD